MCVYIYIYMRMHTCIHTDLMRRVRKAEPEANAGQDCAIVRSNCQTSQDDPIFRLAHLVLCSFSLWLCMYTFVAGVVEK